MEGSKECEKCGTLNLSCLPGLTFISRWAFIRAWVINYCKPIPWLEDSVHVFPLRTFSHHFLDGLLPFYSFPGLLLPFSSRSQPSSILTLRALHCNVYLIASFPETVSKLKAD